MRHSIEELAERADDHGDGYFYMVRHGKEDSPLAGRWEAGMRAKGAGCETIKGHGETADKAVQDMLNRQEDS